MERLRQFVSRFAFLELLFIAIITVPVFMRLIPHGYFFMHDDQQVARLYLLTKGIQQGQLYPRWVDWLGFGYGYPLFNFYPPFIYYLGFIFHSIGFSFIDSIKGVFITGYFFCAFGAYLFGRKVLGRVGGVILSVLYSYFFYHAVTGYVRGALAEFFSMAVLPFVFLATWNIVKKLTLKNFLFLGIAIAVLILTHPLIALPSVLYLFAWGVYGLIISKEKIRFALVYGSSILSGLLLSMFFWLPSLYEKQYTLVSSILTRELANYSLHFVCPSQFWYSPWGFGGSIAGCEDGFTFQLGKMHLLFAGISLIAFIIVFFRKRVTKLQLYEYIFFFFLLVFSLFMSVEISKPVWVLLSPLAYLQFPWRFLTFAGFYLSLVGAFYYVFLLKLVPKKLSILIVLFLCVITVYKYQAYFKPNGIRTTTEQVLTSKEDVEWRISSSSFEFVPKEVATKKTSLNTTTLAISRKDLPMSLYSLPKNTGKVTLVKNNFSEKSFQVNFSSSTRFVLNTYYFPGWVAYIDAKKVKIEPHGSLYLISTLVPRGNHALVFKFEETPVRMFSDFISLLSFGGFVLLCIFQFKKKNS